MTAEEENRIRRLRDLVYGVPVSYSRWQICKEYWLKTGEVTWLEEQAARIKTPCQSNS